MAGRRPRSPLTLPEKGHNPFTVTARLLLAAFLSLAVVVGCATEPGAISVGSVLEPEQLVFLTRGVCVNTKVMRKRLDQALGALGVSTNYQFIDLDTLPKDDVRVGYPTPTLLYRDADIFGMPKPTPPFLEPT